LSIANRGLSIERLPIANRGLSIERLPIANRGIHRVNGAFAHWRNQHCHGGALRHCFNVDCGIAQLAMAQ
jgi:hypothetical protein